MLHANKFRPPAVQVPGKFFSGRGVSHRSEHISEYIYVAKSEANGGCLLGSNMLEARKCSAWNEKSDNATGLKFQERMPYVLPLVLGALGIVVPLKL